MTGSGREPLPRSAPALSAVLYLVGVAGLAFSLSLLWFGMRAVLDVGGYCASGGPYEIAVECPDAVIASTPLSILGGVLSVGLMLWGGAGLGAGWLGLVFLAWPALFISLGWNFLQYGFFPPNEGWVWSWIFCGIVFVLMGAVPLWIAIAAFRDGPDSDERVYAAGRVVVRPRPPSAAPATPEPSRAVAPSPSPGVPAGSSDPSLREPLVDRLERLADLRRRGDLTSAEFEVAKAATLAEAGGKANP
jgi:hypothetical protein